ncbi:hypothetical protein LI328DRAFT_72701 [Trichoderma asperelloides]|nr:hypothetical protein LI328DRAFT_72701 [Trichoderma asperelloides]
MSYTLYPSFFFFFFVSFLGALGNTALIETGRSTGDFIYPQTGGKVYSLRLRDNDNAYICIPGRTTKTYKRRKVLHVQPGDTFLQMKRQSKQPLINQPTIHPG